MSKDEDNKTVVGRWFTEFWGKRVDCGNPVACRQNGEVHAPELIQ